VITALYDDIDNKIVRTVETRPPPPAAARGGCCGVGTLDQDGVSVWEGQWLAPAQAITQLHLLSILHTPPHLLSLISSLFEDEKVIVPSTSSPVFESISADIYNEPSSRRRIDTPLLNLARGRCLGVRQNRDRHKHVPHCVEMTDFSAVLGEKTRIERERRERLNVEAQHTSSRGGQRLRLDVSERIREIADALNDVPPNDRKGNVLLTILGLCEQMQEGLREQSDKKQAESEKMSTILDRVQRQLDDRDRQIEVLNTELQARTEIVSTSGKVIADGQKTITHATELLHELSQEHTRREKLSSNFQQEFEC
jgi:hypothetical protein